MPELVIWRAVLLALYFLPAIALLKIAARNPKIVREAAGINPPSATAAKR